MSIYPSLNNMVHEQNALFKLKILDIFMSNVLF